LVAAAKFWVAAKYFVVPNFVAVTKPFFPCYFGVKVKWEQFSRKAHKQPYQWKGLGESFPLIWLFVDIS